MFDFEDAEHVQIFQGYNALRIVNVPPLINVSLLFFRLLYISLYTWLCTL
jgi:hypothetical protein